MCFSATITHNGFKCSMEQNKKRFLPKILESVRAIKIEYVSILSMESHHLQKALEWRILQIIRLKERSCSSKSYHIGNNFLSNNIKQNARKNPRNTCFARVLCFGLLGVRCLPILDGILAMLGSHLLVYCMFDFGHFLCMCNPLQ